MPHLARYTVETTRPTVSTAPPSFPVEVGRRSSVVGCQVSQDDEPRKSLWLFPCNLPCKRCSEILPWPQTQIPQGRRGGKDDTDERLVLSRRRIIRSTLPRNRLQQSPSLSLSLSIFYLKFSSLFFPFLSISFYFFSFSNPFPAFLPRFSSLFFSLLFRFPFSFRSFRHDASSFFIHDFL